MGCPVKTWLFLAIATLWQIGTTALAQELTAHDLLEKCLAMQKRTDCISYSCARLSAKAPEAGKEPRSGLDYHLRRQGKLIDFSSTQPYHVRGNKTNALVAGRFVIGEGFSAGCVDNQMQATAKAGDYGTKGLEEKLRRFLQTGQSSARLDGYFYHPELKRVAEVMLESGAAKLAADEMIDDVECKVVEAKTKYGAMKLWLAPESGYLPARTEIRTSADDLAGDGKPIGDFRNDNGKWVKEGVEVVTISKFELIGDAFVPSAGKYTLNVLYTDGSTLSGLADARYERKEIVLDPDFSNTDAFQINFPEGAPIRNLDDLSGVEYEWRAGKVTPVAPTQKPSSPPNAVGP
jgi:hypothetical protein